MELKNKVLPFVLSGTLAFGTMGVPLTALAGGKDAGESTPVAEVNAAAEKKVNEEMDKAPAKVQVVEEPVAEVQQQSTQTASTPVAVTTTATNETEEPAEQGDADDSDGSKKTENTDDGSDEGEQGGETGSDTGSNTGSNKGETGGATGETGSKTGDSPKPVEQDPEEASSILDIINTRADFMADTALQEAARAIYNLPPSAKVTLADQNAYDAANSLYRELTDAQKAVLDKDENFSSYAGKVKLDAVAKALKSASDAKKEEDKQPAGDAKPAEDTASADKEKAAAEKAAADKEAAQAAIDAINALPAAGQLTSAQEKAVYDAKAVYDKLTDDQKKLVDASVVAKMREAVKAVDAAVISEREAAEKAAAEKAAAEKAAADQQKAAAQSSKDSNTKNIRAVQGDTYKSSYSGQGYTRIKYTANLTTEMFIASIGEQARQIGQDKNLYASVMIAQAIIESDSGNSGLSKSPNYNLFGIKGAYQGQSVNMATQEDNGKGNLYTINSDFRRYGNQKESMADYAELLRNDMGHYYNVWKENAETYQDAAKALQGTYATSTIYADSICAVIEAYDLTRFDDPLDFVIEGTIHDPESELADKNGDRPLTMNDYVDLQANAIAQLGTPYVWGGNTTEGFDCSGFVQYLYKETFGISLPRTTYTQQYEGEEVPFDQLQMGDLLFFSEGGSTEHVAMYLGDGFYIHAPEAGDVIKVADMESYTPSFAKRILNLVPVEDVAAEPASADDQEKAQERLAGTGTAKVYRTIAAMHL